MTQSDDEEKSIEYRIDTGYACFYIRATNGVVVFAAPIANWTMGKKIEDVLAYYQRKGAEIDPLH